MEYQQIFRHRLFLPVTVCAGSFGAGAAAGYFFWKSQAKRRKKMNTTTEEVVETTVTIVDQNQFTFKLWDQVDEIEILPDEDSENVIKFERKEEQPVETNVFVDEIHGWDYETELASRSSEEPYVIHRDEFFGDEMGWDNQQSLTWYETDHILCTEDDTVIYNPHLMVGVLRFGHGSGDADLVFIRNERLHAEYEVFRNPGSFELDVLGGHLEEKMAADDLKHSRSPGKFPRD